jgi:hypothetical protein
MFSNNRPGSGYSNSSFGNSGPRPASNEDTLRTEKIQIERKVFVFSLKENPRGRFLRITEDVSGRRDTIIIPAPGLVEFKKIVDEMVKVSSESPEKPA